MPNKKRTSKTSRSERRSSQSVPLTGIEKVLLGGGLCRSFKPMSRQECEDYATSSKAARA